MDSILSRVMKPQPATYAVIKDKSQQKCYGFIAQDVKPLLPEWIDVRTDTANENIPNLHSINYDGFGVRHKSNTGATATAFTQLTTV